MTPRDKTGERLKGLDYILRNEDLKGVGKRLWVINRVTDSMLFEHYREKLCAYEQEFVTIPFDDKKYCQAQAYDEKLLAAIGINQARNRAIVYGHEWANWALILDGDCMFIHEAWEEFVDCVCDDLAVHPDREYYTSPSVRYILEAEDGRLTRVGDKREPFPMFKDTSTIRFDESIPFGKSDKVTLLRTLGHNLPGWENQAELGPDAICRSFSFVCHIGTGDLDTESNLDRRQLQRAESIRVLLDRLDQSHCQGGHDNDGGDPTP